MKEFTASKRLKRRVKEKKRKDMQPVVSAEQSFNALNAYVHN